MHPAGGADQELLFSLKHEHFPFFIRGKLDKLKIKKVHLFVENSEGTTPDFIANIKVTDSAAINDINIKTDQAYSVPHTSQAIMAKTTGSVSLKVKVNELNSDFKSLTENSIRDIYIVFELGK
jgi:hypothetical protein